MFCVTAQIIKLVLQKYRCTNDEWCGRNKVHKYSPPTSPRCQSWHRNILPSLLLHGITMSWWICAWWKIDAINNGQQQQKFWGNQFSDGSTRKLTHFMEADFLESNDDEALRVCVVSGLNAHGSFNKNSQMPPITDQILADIICISWSSTLNSEL